MMTRTLTLCALLLSLGVFVAPAGAAVDLKAPPVAATASLTGKPVSIFKGKLITRARAKNECNRTLQDRVKCLKHYEANGCYRLGLLNPEIGYCVGWYRRQLLVTLSHTIQDCHATIYFHRIGNGPTVYLMDGSPWICHSIAL